MKHLLEKECCDLMNYAEIDIIVGARKCILLVTESQSFQKTAMKNEHGQINLKILLTKEKMLIILILKRQHTISCRKLHFQLMDSSNLVTAKGLPYIFEEYE